MGKLGLGLGLLVGGFLGSAALASPKIPDRFLSTGKYDFVLHHHDKELGMIFPDKFQNWLWILNREGTFAQVWKACEAFQGPNKEDYRVPTRAWVRNANLSFLDQASFWISGCTPSGCTVVYKKEGKIEFKIEDPQTARHPIVCSSGSNFRR